LTRLLADAGGGGEEAGKQKWQRHGQHGMTRTRRSVRVTGSKGRCWRSVFADAAGSAGGGGVLPLLLLRKGM
jgi:hypothetical protein